MVGSKREHFEMGSGSRDRAVDGRREAKGRKKKPTCVTHVPTPQQEVPSACIPDMGENKAKSKEPV